MIIKLPKNIFTDKNDLIGYARTNTKHKNVAFRKLSPKCS